MSDDTMGSHGTRQVGAAEDAEAGVARMLCDSSPIQCTCHWAAKRRSARQLARLVQRMWCLLLLSSLIFWVCLFMTSFVDCLIYSAVLLLAALCGKRLLLTTWLIINILSLVMFAQAVNRLDAEFSCASPLYFIDTTAQRRELFTYMMITSIVMQAAPLSAVLAFHWQTEQRVIEMAVQQQQDSGRRGRGATQQRQAFRDVADCNHVASTSRETKETAEMSVQTRAERSHAVIRLPSHHASSAANSTAPLAQAAARVYQHTALPIDVITAQQDDDDDDDEDEDLEAAIRRDEQPRHLPGYLGEEGEDAESESSVRGEAQSRRPSTDITQEHPPVVTRIALVTGVVVASTRSGDSTSSAPSSARMNIPVSSQPGSPVAIRVRASPPPPPHVPPPPPPQQQQQQPTTSPLRVSEQLPLADPRNLYASSQIRKKQQRKTAKQLPPQPSLTANGFPL